MFTYSMMGNFHISVSVEVLAIHIQLGGVLMESALTTMTLHLFSLDFHLWATWKSWSMNRHLKDAVVARCLNVCEGFCWLRHSVIKQIVIRIQADSGHIEYSLLFYLYSVGTCSVTHPECMLIIHELQVSTLCNYWELIICELIWLDKWMINVCWNRVWKVWLV
jgi:hypothetical protein